MAKSKGTKKTEKLEILSTNLKKDNPKFLINPPDQLPDEEEKKPLLIQSEIDEELKDALSLLGTIQSKYQQLNVTRKSKGLRNAIRTIRHISKDFS